MSQNVCKNYRIISNEEYGSFEPILIKNNIWYKNAKKLEDKNSYLVLHKPGYDSTLSIYSIKNRTILKHLKLRFHRFTTINFVLQIPQTNTLILWTDDDDEWNYDEWNLSKWDLNTNQLNRVTHINCASSFGLELNPTCRQSQFITISTDWSHNWIHVKTWNLNSFECIETLQFQSCGVSWAKINYKNRNIVGFTFTPHGKLKIWDMNSFDSNGCGILLNTVKIVDSKYILLRNIMENQFVTCQIRFCENVATLKIHMWFENSSRKLLYNESSKVVSPINSLNVMDSLLLFDINANEFVSMNLLTGVVKFWCWNTGVCLKSWISIYKDIYTSETLLRKTFPIVSSRFYGVSRQNLIFTRDNYFFMLDLCSRHMTLKKLSDERKTDCLTFLDNLKIESCKFM